MPRPSIAECRASLDACADEALGDLIRTLERDPRAGVRALAAARVRRLDADRRESERLSALMTHQAALHEAGVAIVAGVDEVGRGALAGPLTVAAVVLEPTCRIIGLDDSKRLTPARRESVAVEVHRVALAASIVHVEPGEIDAIGIGGAVRVGMERAVASLGVEVGHTLVDGNDPQLRGEATPVVGGDHLCACIAAASVIAKVARDALMTAMSDEYPAFGFAVNKGYGTAEHLAALAASGPSPVHRRSFSPCSQGPLF